jgi:transcriptional regulator of acetoin/glycerol metabolism
MSKIGGQMTKYTDDVLKKAYHAQQNGVLNDFCIRHGLSRTTLYSKLGDYKRRKHLPLGRAKPEED